MSTLSIGLKNSLHVAIVATVQLTNTYFILAFTLLLFTLFSVG